MKKYALSSSFNQLSSNAQGIFYAIACCLFASILVALVRHLSKEFHVFFIIMVRNFFGLLFFMPQIMSDYKSVLKTNNLHLHIFRGINGLASMIAWFYVVTILPLAEAVSISFIVPILTTIAAVIILKEKVKSNSWIGAAIGFLGILIILRPGFKEFNFAYFYAFASVVLWTISNIVVKVMTKTEKSQTIVAYMSFIMFICSIPIAIPYAKPIGFAACGWFAALGLTSNLTHICISNAYAKSDLSTVQPFDFTRLIFTVIISYFAFQEAIDFWVIAGSLVILIGMLIVMPRNHKAKKQNILIASS